MKKILKFIIYIFGPLALGGIVAAITGFGSYSNIVKPKFSPPALAFPIVWSILYLLMGISLYIINKEKINNSENFFIQLFLNLIWPIFFFKFKMYKFSIIIILLMLYFVGRMIVTFYQIKKPAAYLQIPYFIWLLIALYLNIGVAILN